MRSIASQPKNKKDHLRLDMNAKQHVVPKVKIEGAIALAVTVARIVAEERGPSAHPKRERKLRDSEKRQEVPNVQQKGDHQRDKGGDRTVDAITFSVLNRTRKLQQPVSSRDGLFHIKKPAWLSYEPGRVKNSDPRGEGGRGGEGDSRAAERLRCGR